MLTIYNYQSSKKALNYLQQSLEIAREIGDRNLISSALNNLGNAYSSIGDYPTVIDYLQQSLEIKREIGDCNGISNSFNNLGSAYKYLGDYPRAIDYHQRSLEIKRDIGDRHGQAITWFNLGNTYKALQQKSVAKTTYENARQLYQAMGLEQAVRDCNKAIQSLEEGYGK